MGDLQVERLQRPVTMLTVNELAGVLNCSYRTVYRLSDRGQIPSPVRLGGLVRWPRPIIDRWIAEGCPARPAARKRS